MRVLAVSSSAGLLGAARSFEIAITGARAHGWAISVVCPSPGPLADHLAGSGIPVHVLGKDPGITAECLEGRTFQLSPQLASRAVARLRYIERLRRIIRHERADVVYLNTIRNGSSAVAARAASRPIAWHLREPERDFAGVRRLRLAAVRHFADRVIAVSEHNRAFLVRLGVPARRITVVPNGIDTRRFCPASDQPRADGLPADRPIVGMLGMWAPHKGVLDFLEMAQRVAREVPRAIFLLVGGAVPSDPAYAAAVEAALSSEALRGRVIAAGYHEDVRPYVAAMDVFVMPSHAESFSRVVLEAMSMGRAIVATSVGGTPEAIVDGESGTLCRPGDPAALAEAVCRLLAQPEAARAMARAARARVESEFGVERYVERVEAVWQSAVAVRRAGG